jgi:hypothetical protein
MSTYKFHEPPRRTYGALPEGDYMAVVTEVGEPYVNASGKDVLVVKLAIQPGGQNVYYRPWTGKTVNGDFRDNIAEFLKAVNRAPREGEEPNWNSVLGAKGKCRLKVREYNGDDQNDVAFFYVPRDTKQATTPPLKATNEFEKARAEQAANVNSGAQQTAAASASTTEPEPDDIPY